MENNYFTKLSKLKTLLFITFLLFFGFESNDVSAQCPGNNSGTSCNYNSNEGDRAIPAPSCSYQNLPNGAGSGSRRTYTGFSSGVTYQIITGTGGQNVGNISLNGTDQGSTSILVSGSTTYSLGRCRSSAIACTTWNGSSALLQFRIAPPTTANAGADVNTCNGSTTLVGNSPSVGSGSWSKVSGSGNITSGGSVTSVAANSSGTFRYTINNGGCTSSDDVVVTNPTPSALPTISVSPSSTCEGNFITFTRTSCPAGATCYWQTSASGTSTGNSSASINSTTTPGTKTFFLRPRSNTGGCWGTAVSASGTVNPNPSAPSSPVNAFECPADLPAVLSATPPSGSTIDWYANPSGGGALATNTSTFTTSTPGTYYAQSRNTTTGCISPSRTAVSLTLKIESTTPTNISLSDNGYCSNNIPGSLTLDVSGGTLGTGGVIRWFTGSCLGTSVGVGNPLVLTGGSVPTTTTTFYAVYDGDCGFSPGCAERTVTVLQPPTAPPTTVSVNPTVNCENALPPTIQLISSGGSPGTGGNANWYTGSCGGTFIANGSSPTVVNPGVTTTYYVRYENTCGVTTCEQVTYTVDLLPVASAGGTQTICVNSAATVSGASASNGTILWTHDGSGSISGATTLTPTYTPNSADAGNSVTLTMTVTSNNTCGAATDVATYTVNVDPLPEASAGGSESICPGDGATVSGASASNGTILWTHDGSGSISGATTLTPTYTSVMADAGNTVTLTMTVTSNNTCNPETATATYTVEVQGGSSNATLVSGTSVNATEECLDGAWTYYSTAANPDEFVFAIRKNGSSFTAEVNIIDEPGTTTYSSLGGVGPARGTFLIGRTWDVTITSGSITNPVDIRFFVDPAEVTQAQNEANALQATTPIPGSVVTPLTFFKHPTTAFDPLSMMPSGNFDFTPSNTWVTPTSGTINGVTYYEMGGITSFSGGTGGFSVNDGSPALLPVELLDFSANAKESHIQLNWSTATEINNDGFEVQRSRDGENFETIAWVNGNGNTSNVQNYSHNDFEAISGINYYRLKQVDFDGAFEYTYIVSAKLSGAQLGLVVNNLRPNPANEKVFLDVEIEESSSSVVTIYNHMGQKVIVLNTALEKGKNVIDIETTQLTSGAYIVSIESNNSVVTKKFVIAK